MFKTIKQIFSAKNKDIRKKILYTLLVLLIYKVGTSIRVPGTSGFDAEEGFLGLLNVMAGGALEQTSIFALGVTPYISASIIVQLLQMDIIPYFSNLAKEGHTGRVKLNKITRYMGILLAFLQGLLMSISFIGTGNSAINYITVALILTAGTCFLLWLGDQVTQKGVGNGVSMIIMAGILISTKTMVIDAFNYFIVTGSVQEIAFGVTKFLLFMLLYISIIVGVVFIEKSERRVPIQYANKTQTAYGAKQTYIPFKLNSAGVMPVIFASSLMSIPSLIATFVGGDFGLFVNQYINYTTPVGFIIYLLLIIGFTYLYTFMASGLKPKELAENLNKNGGYIPGVRPGKDTKKYISSVLSRITLLGAIFLMVIAGLPILVSMLSSGLPSTITIGGTGLLIVVGVALETYKQLEGSLVSRNYKKGYSRR